MFHFRSPKVNIGNNKIVINILMDHIPVHMFILNIKAISPETGIFGFHVYVHAELSSE